MGAPAYSGRNFWNQNVPENAGGASQCIVVGESYRPFDFNSDNRRSDARIVDSSDSDVPAELRTDQRFAVNMELRYSYRSEDLTYIGTGRTWNLSNSAVCFEMDQEVRAGDLEVRIAWPSRLQHVCGLELVLRGRIGRKGPNFAV